MRKRPGFSVFQPAFAVAYKSHGNHFKNCALYTESKPTLRSTCANGREAQWKKNNIQFNVSTLHACSNEHGRRSDMTVIWSTYVYYSSIYWGQKWAYSRACFRNARKYIYKCTLTFTNRRQQRQSKKLSCIQCENGMSHEYNMLTNTEIERSTTSASHAALRLTNRSLQMINETRHWTALYTQAYTSIFHSYATRVPAAAAALFAVFLRYFFIWSVAKQITCSRTGQSTPDRAPDRDINKLEGEHQPMGTILYIHDHTTRNGHNGRVRFSVEIQFFRLNGIQFKCTTSDFSFTSVLKSVNVRTLINWQNICN